MGASPLRVFGWGLFRVRVRGFIAGGVTGLGRGSVGSAGVLCGQQSGAAAGYAGRVGIVVRRGVPPPRPGANFREYSRKMARGANFHEYS